MRLADEPRVSTLGFPFQKGGYVNRDDQVLEAERGRLWAERMDQIRMSGRVLIVLGTFLISLADTITQVIPEASAFDPNPDS